MIELRITADSMKDFHNKLLGVLAGADTGGTPPATQPTPAPAAEDKPKASRGKSAKKDTEASSPPADTPANGEATSSNGPSATNGASPSDPTGDAAAAAPAETSATTTADAVDPQAIAAKCTKFATKAGPVALTELFTELGSPTGKWSAFPPENLPALNARLDDLLAGE